MTQSIVEIIANNKQLPINLTTRYKTVLTFDVHRNISLTLMYTP